ncbi:MAG TPA: serine/threonine-protein kinase [Kofleriaceae bacterium]|jgi:tetratricopeptide (TPR) repeat protein
MASCPSDLDWTRWFSDGLTAERRAELLAHLDSCEDCRAVCAALAPDERQVVPSGAERYTLGEQIARGGMGRILRARDRVLGRDVALKMPHAQAGAQARFAREIAILARLSHPSIVTVLDAGQIDPETPFFAMPFLAGRTLAEEVAAGHIGREALLTTIPAISAIAYAHSLGIVHRDLKPTNLFVGPFGECTVLDWGIAIVLGEDTPNSGGWSEGYASPEQRDGGPPVLDHDVYALGAMLRFVMCGTHKIGPADRSIPPELRSIIVRATARTGTRYATATELLADVQRYLAQGRVRAHRYTYRQSVARWLRRHRTAAAALATAAIAASVVGGWSVSRIIAERDRAVAAEHASRAARTRTLELTNFLLDQVNHSVAELGRLDLATNLVVGLEQHIATAPIVDGDPDEGAELVQLLELRGLMTDIALAKGDVDPALRYLATVDATLARLPQGTAMTAYLRCEALMRTAEARRSKGDPAAARAALQQCIAALAGVPPTVASTYPRFDTVHTAAEAYVALGDLLRDGGESDAALVSYHAAAAAFHDAKTDDARVAVERLVLQAAIQQRIGSIAQFAQRYDEAQTRYQAALTFAEAAVARRENEASAQWLVAQVQVALAIAVGERGDAEQKKAWIAKAARIAEPLFAVDPTNDEHARWMTILWRAEAEVGAAAEAPALFDRILEVSRRRAQLQPRSVATVRDLAVDLTAAATAFVDSDLPERRRQALAICTEAIAVMQQAQQLLTGANADVALTLLHCAEVASALGDKALAQTRRQQAMDETRAHATRTDTEMLAAYSTGIAAYLTDASAAERHAQAAEMDRVWAELRAAAADDLMANMRDIAPWWQPKEK